MIERPRGSLATRAFGTVVHALLEDLARLPGIDAEGVPQALLAEVGGWRPRALAMLRSAGLPRAEAEPQSAEVVRALQAVLQDATGRWILGARAGAQTETSWSGWADVGRRRSGAHVCAVIASFALAQRPVPKKKRIYGSWTIRRRGMGHPAWMLFWQAKRRSILPQLEAYAAVMRKVHGEKLPLRLALYYPLLTKLVWW